MKIANSKRKQGVPLYVAGLPAQIPLSCVVDYFSEINQCFYLKSPSSKDQAIRQKAKGYCYLECHDKEAAQSILEQRFFNFYGRTLTIMLRKKGVALIIQNKNAKRSRIFLKRVNRFTKEGHLREAIEKEYGPVDMIFQLKSDDPFDRIKVSKVQNSQYHTYSIHFKSHNHAKALLNVGKLVLKDGQVLQACKSNDLTKYRNLPLNINSDPSTKPSPLDQNKSAQFKTLLRDSDIRLDKYTHSNLSKSIPKIDCNHEIKPTSKTYSLSTFGKWRSS